MITIEKNIPIPSSREMTMEIKEVLRKMQIGDSFEMPVANRNRMAQAISHFYKRVDANKKFVCRQSTDKTKVRCWRTK